MKDHSAAALPRLQVAALLPRSLVNGPGVRAVLWVQGCPFACPGCFNRDFRPFAGGTAMSVTEAAGLLLAEPEIEGITFSGGEPFSQATALSELAAQARAVGKGIVIFTGYSGTELLASPNFGHQALLAQADLLIAGPYLAGNPSPHPLLASANQELIFISERYCNQVWTKPGKRHEYRFRPDGSLAATGLLPGRGTETRREQQGAPHGNE